MTAGNGENVWKISCGIPREENTARRRVHPSSQSGTVSLIRVQLGSIMNDFFFSDVKGERKEISIVIVKEGREREKKQLHYADKRSVFHLLKCFVLFVSFFPLLEVPARYVWLTSRSLWQTSTHRHTHTHSLAFTSGHARKVSIPGFFQQLP